MERTIFLKNYRIRRQYDGTPYEPDRDGPTTSYEGVDERTAEPVLVTLIPKHGIDPAEHAGFEEYMSAAQKLRHANVAKVLDFGRDGDDYVYVSERLGGETLASWVRSHGPMPADAALRVGEQIVSVLSSASFHKLPYPPIQPSDVILVPGQTAEGTWPFVKLTNFGLPELNAGPASRPIESDSPEKLATEKGLNDQRFALPTTDIRSEIYSLGVTLYFLLSGVVLSAEAVESGPKFTGFPKPLRTLLGKLLHRNPDQRPKDLLIVTELIREALGKVERRRELSDRYGIPLRTSVPRPRKTVRTRPLVQAAAAVGVILLLLLLAAAISPLVFPNSVSNLVREIRKPKQVGVLVGVPDSSPAASQPHALPQIPVNPTPAQTAVVSSQPGNQTVPREASAPANAATTPNPFHIAQADVQQAQMATAQPQSAPPTNSAGNSAAPPASDSSASSIANSPTQANTEPASHATRQSSSRDTQKSVASKSKHSPPNRSPGAYSSSQGRIHSVRSRVTGITSDGRLILRLPSGRTAIVAPDEDASRPRHRGRVYMDRDQMSGPPPGFGPENFPDD